MVRMRDYSPAWLFACPEILQLQPSALGLDSGTQSETQLEWIKPWLAEQHQKAKATPWQAAPSEEKLPVKEIFIRAPKQNITSPIRSAESGQRFHALMEHADPSLLKGRKFLHDLLNSASARIHELEMWSAAELPQNHLNAGRGLFATQRRIIDLFCAISSKSLPKDFLKHPCLKVTNTPHETKTQISELALCLKNELDIHPYLHLVIDFKTGAPDPEHMTQMQRYLSWIKDVLQTHPEQLLGSMTPETLFAESVRPLVGIIYYSSRPSSQQVHHFAPPLVGVDKNAAVLFIIPE
jgi:hypothetical protein